MSVDIQRLRDDADGARGVADRNPEIHYTADNMDAAADALERAERQVDELVSAIEDHLIAGEYTAPSQYVRADRALYDLARKIKDEREGEK